MKKRSAVEEGDSGNGNGPGRSREQRMALYAKIKGDAVAEFRTRQQQCYDWIEVADIEKRMRERRGDFAEKGQIPDTLQLIFRNIARGDYGDRILLWVEQRRWKFFGRRWLVKPEAAPDSAFVSKDMMGCWRQLHGEEDMNDYLISNCWVRRATAIEWLRADGIEPPPGWKPERAAAEVCGTIEAVRTGMAGGPEPAAAEVCGAIEAVTTATAGRPEPAAADVCGAIEAVTTATAGRPEPAAAEVCGPIEALRTGTAGRPTSKHLALTEMIARHSRGELAPTLDAEACELVEWLKKERERLKGLPVPTARSLANSIRHEYRKVKDIK